MGPTCSSLVSVLRKDQPAFACRIEVSVKTPFLRITGLMLGLLISSCLAVAQTHKQKPDPCKDTSHMTQGEMNGCALKDLHETELKLERLLKQLGIASNSPEQKAWEATGTHSWPRSIHQGMFQAMVLSIPCVWPS